MSGACEWLTSALAEIFADRTLRPHDKLVLLALTHHGYSRAGECWPSRATLALETGLSIDSVKRALERLTKSKTIQRTRRPRLGDRHESNVYRVDVCRGGVGCREHPRWGAASTPNRISKAGESSSLLISEPSSLPPGGVKGAVVSSFVPAKLVELAESLFGEPRRRLVISALRKLNRELGEEVAPDEMARFLRYQAKHRNVTNLGAPISAACDAAELQRWRRLHTRSEARAAPARARVAPTPPTPETHIPRSELGELARIALRTLPAAARTARRSTRPPTRN